VRDASEEAIQAAFAAGADDVVPRHKLSVLARRVDIALRAKSTPTMRAPAYSALIIGTDIEKRRLYGRTLRVAGYAPAFAQSMEDAAERLNADRHDLAVVLASEGAPTDWNVVESLRAATRADLPVILVSREAQIED